MRKVFSNKYVQGAITDTSWRTLNSVNSALMNASFDPMKVDWSDVMISNIKGISTS